MSLLTIKKMEFHIRPHSPSRILRSEMGSRKVRKRDSTGSVTPEIDQKSETVIPTPGPTSAPFILNEFIEHELKLMYDLVNDAIKKHKIFTVYGNFYSIRKALVRRGWVEKLNDTFVCTDCNHATTRHILHLSISQLAVGLTSKKLGHIYRLAIMSAMIGNAPINFCWDLRKHTYNSHDGYLNSIGRTKFVYASKDGLCQYSNRLKNPIISKLRMPRTYCLSSNKKEWDEFKKDFRITAAISVLKWILMVHKDKNLKLISTDGTIPIWVFYFAINECDKYIKYLRCELLDQPEWSNEKWNKFLQASFKLFHEGNHFEYSHTEYENTMLAKSQIVLRKLKQLHSFRKMDGCKNIWILKPSNGTNGVGIHLCRTMDEVADFQPKNSYIVQKYIESPLLIQKTKFDIRQWFLISSTEPLTIWLYKDCYLRFSSQMYNLKDLHESIHLTNNCIQSKYINSDPRRTLPVYNMWFLKEFKQYLAQAGHPWTFDQIIYPGMRDCIIASILGCLDQLCRSSKPFEFLGADFMLTEDFRPLLIEINSRPDMTPSTPVTSTLCPAVLEDILKVVIDYAKNPKAPTGKFELVYKEIL